MAWYDDQDWFSAGTRAKKYTRYHGERKESVWGKRDENTERTYKLWSDESEDYSSLDTYTDNLPASASWLSTMCAALSGSFKIKIERGSAWGTDIKTRTLTYPPDQLAELTRRSALALLLHTIGLVVYTDEFVYHGSKEDVDRAKAFYATLEDVFVGSRILAEYAGSAPLISSIRTQGYNAAQLFIEGLDKKAENYKNAAIAIAADPNLEHPVSSEELPLMMGMASAAIPAFRKSFEDKIREGRAEILRVADVFASGVYAEKISLLAQRYYYATKLGYYEYSAPWLDEPVKQIAYDVAKAMMKNAVEEVKTTAEATAFYDQHILPIVFQYKALGIKRSSGDGSDGKGDGKGRASTVKGGGSGFGKRIREEMSAGTDKRALDSAFDDLKDSDKKQNLQDRRRRDGSDYSPTGAGMSGLQAYAYYLEPYRGRLATARAQVARKLDMNKPSAPRGAYRSGKFLASRRLYRHRLDDPKLFSRREQEAKRSYALSIYADVSGSTCALYGKDSKGRTITDEIIAAELLAVETLARLDGAKYEVGIFSNDAVELKRMSEHLDRDNMIRKTHGVVGGGTNIEKATKIAFKTLRETQAEDKLAIIITDGAIHADGYAEDVNEMIQSGERFAFMVVNDCAQNICDSLRQAFENNNKTRRALTDRLISLHTLTPSHVDELPRVVCDVIIKSFKVSV